MLQVETPADMDAHVGETLGTSEVGDRDAGDDRHLRRRDR